MAGSGQTAGTKGPPSSLAQAASRPTHPPGMAMAPMAALASRSSAGSKGGKAAEAAAAAASARAARSRSHTLCCWAWAAAAREIRCPGSKAWPAGESEGWARLGLGEWRGSLGEKKKDKDSRTRWRSSAQHSLSVAQPSWAQCTPCRGARTCPPSGKQVEQGRLGRPLTRHHAAGLQREAVAIQGAGGLDM